MDSYYESMVDYLRVTYHVKQRTDWVVADRQVTWYVKNGTTSLTAINHIMEGIIKEGLIKEVCDDVVV